jgi:hypothetical protein
MEPSRDNWLGKYGKYGRQDRKKSAGRRGNWRSMKRKGLRQSRDKWRENQSDAGGRTVRPRPCVGASWLPGSPGRRAAGRIEDRAGEKLRPGRKLDRQPKPRPAGAAISVRASWTADLAAAQRGYPPKSFLKTCPSDGPADPAKTRFMAR